MVASDFFNRLSAYPMVASACHQAAAGLTWAKDRSAYAKSAAELAESGLRRAAKSASPLLARYEERATGLDRLACRQLLDRLETACPTVLEPTDKVVKRGREYYSVAVKPKVDLVLSPVTVAAATAESVKSAGVERYRRAVASRLGQSGLRRFDRLIELLGDCADRCLPPGPDEKTAASTKNAEAKQQEEEKPEPAGHDIEYNDEESGEEGGEPKATEPADPVRSMALAYELGRRLGARAADRLTVAGHRLVERLTRRSNDNSAAVASDENSSSGNSSAPNAATASSNSESSTAKNSSSRRSARGGGVDEVDEENDEDEAADESALDRSDMSTD